ncbi:MAG: MBL fold metallo-hydrolase [Thermoleophilaceae bacterium]|nr:MBL fold metallo-hydrolase [Thermoleophilaceae bacterium]
MRLTVLGKSPAWQDAGGACSGYLLEDGDSTALIDIGNGVFAKLRRYRDYTRLDAIVISHLHADHFLDLIPYSYALIYAPRQQPVPVDRWPGTDRPARPLVLGPPGTRQTLRRIIGSWGPEDLAERAFEIEEYAESSTPEVGSLRFEFQAVPHFQETYAIAATSSNGGGRLVFGADSRPSDNLTRFARGADLLLAEATLPRPERTGERGHLTPAEAGDHARAAGVRRLVLTHISDELDQLWALKEAERAFGGPVEVAREGAVYEL